MKIEMIKTVQLIPYENNPRNIGQDAVNAVVSSIQEFGFQQPLVVDKNNVVVVGHTRLQAAQKLGLDKVPCVRADKLTSEQINSYRIIDNKSNSFATWDYTKLESELKQLDLTSEVISFNFDQPELDALIGSGGALEPENPAKVRRPGKSIRFTKDQFEKLTEYLNSYRSSCPEATDADAVMGICEEWFGSKQC